jgi:hypothetical protein
MLLLQISLEILHPSYHVWAGVGTTLKYFVIEVKRQKFLNSVVALIANHGMKFLNRIVTLIAKVVSMHVLFQRGYYA